MSKSNSSVILNSKLIFFILSLLTCISNFSCTKHKFIADQDIQKITLKLSKNINVNLEKIGSTNTNFNMLAKIQSEETIIDASITWLVSDSTDQVLFKSTDELVLNKKTFEIESENFNLPSEDENYKIIFIFNGRTNSEDINKTEIYYSKTQEDIDKAIQDLQDRANP